MGEPSSAASPPQFACDPAGTFVHMKSDAGTTQTNLLGLGREAGSWAWDTEETMYGPRL